LAWGDGRWGDIANVTEVVDFVVVDRFLANDDLIGRAVYKAIAKNVCTTVVDECVCGEPQLLKCLAPSRRKHSFIHCFGVVAIAHR